MASPPVVSTVDVSRIRRGSSVLRNTDETSTSVRRTVNIKLQLLT